MNAFTGGCHYDDGCGRYANRCGACPQLGSALPNDLSQRVWARKKRVFDRINPARLQLVTPSRWLAGEVKRSSLLRDFPVTVIPNGVDTDCFAPRDRQFARQVLGVPEDADVVLFVAEGVRARRKGFLLLSRALAELRAQRRLVLLSVGGGAAAMNSVVEHRHIGHLGDERLLSLVYSAADVFVVPSLQDNLPNTILESLACGTPMVAFAVGGIPDAVHPEETGLLAPPFDVTALRDAIARLLDDSGLQAELSAHCRRVALEEYSQGVQARRYAELDEHVVLRDQPSVPAAVPTSPVGIISDRP
jgi:glycosyltransferase involved in cell wall biosynthesis